MNRFAYSNSISKFIEDSEDSILGILTRNHPFDLGTLQRDAWIEQIRILKTALGSYCNLGAVYFEYSIPRLSKRIDVVAIIKHALFILEFKVGEKEFPSNDLDQVCDYSLDLKNFHETSHSIPIIPILVATNAPDSRLELPTSQTIDNLFPPIKCNEERLKEAIERVLNIQAGGGNQIDSSNWERGRYCPTPTIIEAATALYNGHSVEEISRNDASAINLDKTSSTISEIIKFAKKESKKVICFVTGVPGAGKTLVGLDIATKHINKEDDLYSVFLSGNGPLVNILREALARDKVIKEKEKGNKVKKGEALSEVKLFVQNIHHFRDDCLEDIERPPIEHVALFG